MNPLLFSINFTFMIKISKILLFVLGFSIVCSCSTYYQKNLKFQEYASSGDFEKAQNILLKNKKGPTGKNKILTSAYDFKLNPVSEMFAHKELGKMKANKAIGLGKNSVLDFYVTQPGSLPPVNLYHQFFLEAWKISFSLEICKGHCPLQTR